MGVVTTTYGFYVITHPPPSAHVPAGAGVRPDPFRTAGAQESAPVVSIVMRQMVEDPKHIDVVTIELQYASAGVGASGLDLHA